MSATTFNLLIEQGIPYSKKFLVRNADNSSVNITGWTARMHFRTTVSSTTVSLDASTENGKLVIDSNDSSVSIELSELDTKNLTYEKYVYDLEIVDTTNKPIRLVQGTVILSREITRT